MATAAEENPDPNWVKDPTTREGGEWLIPWDEFPDGGEKDSSLELLIAHLKVTRFQISH